MQQEKPPLTTRQQILWGAIGVISLSFIAWVINGPMTEAKLQRIVKEQTMALTKLPAGEDNLSFLDAQGQPHSLKEFNGKPLVMNLWATWCSPCIREMPILAALQERYSDRLHVIAISTDANGFADINTFIEKNPMPHPPFYHDEGLKLFKHLKIRGLPTTFILNAQGQTVAKMERAIEENDKELLELLDEVTAQPHREPNPDSK